MGGVTWRHGACPSLGGSGESGRQASLHAPGGRGVPSGVLLPLLLAWRKTPDVTRLRRHHAAGGGLVAARPCVLVIPCTE
ncbi:hypothetical protein E2C01_005721 [Portunus trituberculatus]|uniref:Uncharacterized protein n=1 Tax=Portunus trituberculatus TaxID=210409 RepID=A0A5B7CZW5_PORTR|nr:hypothetical protein [Portunus trituberculatus]